MPPFAEAPTRLPGDRGLSGRERCDPDSKTRNETVKLGSALVADTPLEHNRGFQQRRRRDEAGGRGQDSGGYSTLLSLLQEDRNQSGAVEDHAGRPFSSYPMI